MRFARRSFFSVDFDAHVTALRKTCYYIKLVGQCAGGGRLAQHSVLFDGHDQLSILNVQCITAVLSALPCDEALQCTIAAFGNGSADGDFLA
ncbi:hypothetical protein D3C87_1964870 [compost metagenome]